MKPLLIRVWEGNVFLAWGHRKRRKWGRNGRKLRWQWRGELRTGCVGELMGVVY